jgi:hypothetical protein
VQIHIDDFGTGYSSLEALHRLPIDALKIDRSFVANLQDNKSTELVRTIVQLGRNLGVDVIAEGIETPAQQHALAELGCPFGQGYWFSVPVPAARLGELLSLSGPLPVPCEAIPRAEGGTEPHKRQVVGDKPGRKGGLRLVNGKPKRPVAPVDLSLVKRPDAADELLSGATPQTPRG